MLVLARAQALSPDFERKELVAPRIKVVALMVFRTKYECGDEGIR
jgi:hypothetical protein